MTDKAVYTLAEVAALTELSRQTVTRKFEKEGGYTAQMTPWASWSGSTAWRTHAPSVALAFAETLLHSC